MEGVLRLQSLVLQILLSERSRRMDGILRWSTIILIICAASGVESSYPMGGSKLHIYPRVLSKFCRSWSFVAKISTR